MRHLFIIDPLERLHPETDSTIAFMREAQQKPPVNDDDETVAPDHRSEGPVVTILIGMAGSGKTTLIDRVCGLLNEEDSHWQLNGAGNTWRLSGLAGARQMHQLIAYAPQNAVLFEASLRENLLLGADHHQDAIETWLQRLGLAHLLERPGGLDTPLALAQDPFSGGEIHRLGLLRAWLRDKPQRSSISAAGSRK